MASHPFLPYLIFFVASYRPSIRFKHSSELKLHSLWTPLTTSHHCPHPHCRIGPPPIFQQFASSYPEQLLSSVAKTMVIYLDWVQSHKLVPIISPKLIRPFFSGFECGPLPQNM
jgi:hypothetical protein